MGTHTMELEIICDGVTYTLQASQKYKRNNLLVNFYNILYLTYPKITFPRPVEALEWNFSTCFSLPASIVWGYFNNVHAAHLG